MKNKAQNTIKTVLLLLFTLVCFSVSTANAQVKIYNDLSDNLKVEFSETNIKTYTAGSSMSVYNNSGYFRIINQTFEGQEYVIRNVFYTDIQNSSGSQLAATAEQTLDSISSFIARMQTSGEANTASNIGAGVGVFSSKQDFDLQFKSLISANDGISITSGASQIQFSLNDVGTGWAVYTDNSQTVSNQLTVQENGYINLPNNQATTITTHIPSGVSTFYNLGKITPENIGDAYNISIRMIVTPLQNTNQEVLLRIILSDNNVIYEDEKSLPKGVGDEHFVSFSAIVYSLDTFVADGGTVQVRATGGDIGIYGINYLIVRTHKAR